MASGSGSEYDYLVICVVLFSMSCYLKCYVLIKMNYMLGTVSFLRFLNSESHKNYINLLPKLSNKSKVSPSTTPEGFLCPS